MSPASVRFPFPAKELLVFEGDPSEVDAVAAGFWTNSMHDVGPAELVHVVPQFVPGEHKETVPLVIERVA